MWKNINDYYLLDKQIQTLLKSIYLKTKFNILTKPKFILILSALVLWVISSMITIFFFLLIYFALRFRTQDLNIDIIIYFVAFIFVFITFCYIVFADFLSKWYIFIWKYVFPWFSLVIIGWILLNFFITNNSWLWQGINFIWTMFLLLWVFYLTRIINSNNKFNKLLFYILLTSIIILFVFLLVILIDYRNYLSNNINFLFFMLSTFYVILLLIFHQIFHKVIILDSKNNQLTFLFVLKILILFSICTLFILLYIYNKKFSLVIIVPFFLVFMWTMSAIVSAYFYKNKYFINLIYFFVFRNNKKYKTYNSLINLIKNRNMYYVNILNFWWTNIDPKNIINRSKNIKEDIFFIYYLDENYFLFEEYLAEILDIIIKNVRKNYSIIEKYYPAIKDILDWRLREEDNKKVLEDWKQIKPLLEEILQNGTIAQKEVVDLIIRDFLKFDTVLEDIMPDVIELYEKYQKDDKQEETIWKVVEEKTEDKIEKIIKKLEEKWIGIEKEKLEKILEVIG